MGKSAFEIPLRKLVSEAIWLCEEFSHSSKNPNLTQGQLAGEMATIRLHDAWARFCRELIILSAYGNVLTLGGLKLNTSLPAIKSRADVIPVLLTMYKKRRNEPFWYSSSECIDAGQRLKIQNLKSVSAALGATNSPAELLRDVRNFYAHRKKTTAQKAILAGSFTGPHSPKVFHLNAYASAGRTIIESWKDELIAIANAAAQ